MNTRRTDPAKTPQSKDACPCFRRDVEWVRYLDLRKWVARDPLSIAYYYFSEVEYSAAKLCDGSRTLNTIVHQLNRLFPGHPINDIWLHILLRKWRHACLLMPTSSMPGNDRRTRSRRSGWIAQSLLSPMCIKVPLLRPRGHSRGMHRAAGILFHPFAFLIVCVLGFIGFTLVTAEVLRESFVLAVDPTQWQGAKWITLIASYLVIKSLHELGHVLACVRWGAGCKEIGLMFLFFMPCLYCDTTDSWKLASRWKRATISAGGIYVELWIAMVAAWVWLNTDDVYIRTITASAMIVCTAGTLLVNGNPFFRYDGYYLLSDLWGVPNLGEQSSRALNCLLVHLLGGRRLERAEFDAHPSLLAIFALASYGYRIAMLAMILWLAWYSLVPLGLGAVAILIYFSASIAMIVGTKRSFDNLISEFYAPQPIHTIRFLGMVAFIVFAAWFAVMIPIPDYVGTRGALDFEDRVPVFSPETARLESLENIEVPLRKGQEICRFECPEKRMEWKQKKAEIELVASRIQLLRKTSTIDASAAFELPSQLEMLHELENQLALLQPFIDALAIRAPHDGYFVPTISSLPLAITSPVKKNRPGQIVHKNRIGCTIDKGVRIGWFTDRQQPIVRGLVSESEIQKLRPGMAAECVLDSRTHEKLLAKVKFLTSEPIERVPDEFANEHWLQAQRNENGLLQPSKPHYEVTLELLSRNRETFSHREGSMATIRIELPKRTLYEQTKQWIQQTMRMSPR